ncbi:MAG: hypothetical protein HYV29_14810 [Ignavibacteriales bacterium]|nr:hypothetical protein [Ignavibacteriales bacterium]
MKYFFLLCLSLLCSDALESRPSFFQHRNALKFGIGTSEFNKIPGLALHTEYTRYLANIFFVSARFSYASASDNSPNAYYASQDMYTTGISLKINPLVVDRHIVSLRAGVNQNFYSCEGNYGKGLLSTPTGYARYSKSTNGTGYSLGANYDYLLTRFYFISVGATAIKYDETLYYFSISIGTLF